MSHQTQFFMRFLSTFFLSIFFDSIETSSILTTLKRRMACFITCCRERSERPGREQRARKKKISSIFFVCAFNYFRSMKNAADEKTMKSGSKNQRLRLNALGWFSLLWPFSYSLLKISLFFVARPCAGWNLLLSSVIFLLLLWKKELRNELVFGASMRRSEEVEQTSSKQTKIPHE